MAVTEDRYKLGSPAYPWRTFDGQTFENMDMAYAKLYVYDDEDVSDKEYKRRMCEWHVHFYDSYETPLFYAASRGIMRMAKLFLTDVNYVDREYNTPLNSAAHNGHLEMCKLLFDNGAKLIRSSNKPHAIIDGARNGHTDIVKWCLENGDHCVKSLNYALFQAAEYNYIDIVNCLLDAGADPTANDMFIGRYSGVSSLNIAMEKNNDAIVNAFEAHINRSQG